MSAVIISFIKNSIKLLDLVVYLNFVMVYASC